MHDVSEDEGASPAEVVEAGRAVDAARSRDAVLVAYTVHPDTGEGRSAAAWRLYDDAGDTLAEEHAGLSDEGSAHPRVHALPDGFLVADAGGPWWHLGTDGTRKPVVRARTPMPARPGDVRLDDGSPRLFRPATHTLFRVAPRPRGHWQGWTVAADGTTWMQGAGTVRNGPVPFFRSTGGRPWEPVAAHDAGAGRTVSSMTLTAVGTRVVAAVLDEGPAPDRARLVALVVRPGAGPRARPWQVLRPPRGVDGDDWFDVRVAAVDTTTALVGAWGGRQYLVDLGTRRWRPMPAPSDEDDWSYEVEDGRIHAFNDQHADAWATDDRGATWQRLPH